MNSIVDDVNTMSVAAESHTYLLKQRAETPPAMPQPHDSTAPGVLYYEQLVRSVRDIEQSVYHFSELIYGLSKMD